MKKNPICRAFFIPALLATVLLVSSCDNETWTRQGNTNFSAEFPGPARDTVTIEDNMSSLRLYYEPEKTSDPNAYYDISESIMSTPLDSLGKSLDDALAADAQVYAWSIDGTLVGKGVPVVAGKFKGYEYTIRMPDNLGIVKLRKFVYGSKLYTLKVITPIAHQGNAAVNKFLNSFEIKEKK